MEVGMEIARAIQVIRALANGVHFESGAALDETSICRAPDAIKALNRALAALVVQEAREKKRPKNAGKNWSHEEDAQICDELRQGLDFNQIARSHNRSLAAILARLVKLGKITPEKSAHLFPPKVA
jgi:DNA-binding NarL/FixJ family response regulator